MILRREATREHDVAVENRAGGVGHRLVEIVTVHEHGVDAGDATGGGIAGALQQARKIGEHRGRIALGGGRFAGGEADLAPGHRDARDRVHHEQHLLALVAEVFGDRRGHERTAGAHERGLIAGGHDHDGAGETFLTQRVLDELAYFTTALTEQRDHVHIGLRVARNHTEHGRLADAGTGEDADALATTDREQSVDRAHARFHRTVDRVAREGIRRFGGERDALHGVELALAVDRMTEAVQHAPQQSGPDIHTERTAERLHAGAGMQAVEFTEGHEQHAALVESHHLGQYRPITRMTGDPAQ